MNKLHKLLIIALLLIMGGNTLKAQRVGDTFSKTYNEEEETAYTLTFKITQLDPPECTITEGTNPSDSTSLEIPSTIDGYDVTTIGYRAFAQCDKFTGDLVIPNTVKIIEGFAFEWCRGFNGTLKLSDSLTSIGDNAFADNNKLKGTLTIPDKVKYIGKSAFISCVGFTGDLIIPNSVTYIGLGAFSYMNFNGRLQISENITSIEDYTFDYCDFTGELVIPNSVKTIGKRAFIECKNFTGDLVIPNSVETIGESAFENCTGFEGSLTIGENVKNIENNAFKGCVGLKGDLVIPNSVETIGESAFENCTGFEGSLTIGENVKNIENNAFKGCVGLTGDLVIPEKVTYIFEGAFQGCTNLTGKLVISNSVTSISTSAFENCTGFTGDLIIPNSVTKIGESAFKNCSGFDGKLIISTGVETIQYGAFSGCSNLTGDLVIPDNVKSIGMFAFENCSGFDGNLTLSENLTYINNFVFSGCSNLKGSLVIPDNVKSIGMYAFENCYGFTGDLKIPNNVTTIGNYAFNGCYGFTGDLKIPNSVTSIGDYAFDGCSSFTGDLKIPNSVTTIGESAFKNCYDFTGNLVISDNVKTIGNAAFENCYGFTGDLTIPNSVTAIGETAFKNCYGFTGNLVISNSVTSIRTSTFENCSGLDSLTIPNSVTYIYSHAFAGCTNLTTVITSCSREFYYEFDDDVTMIGKHAYENGVCTICDKACDHSESTHETYTDNGDGTHSFTCSVCNTEATEDHTGGTATCQTPAVCEHCGTSYGELDPNNHEYENNNGICCETIQPATLVTNDNYESLGLTAEYVDFYQIGNAGQLFWFANHINTVDRTASAVLTADIDLENRPWTPIGSTGENSNNFRGVFDGQNHTIKGLYVEGGRAGLGFFGEVRTGTVKNFTIYGEVVVNTEVNYVGGVIGSTCGLNGSDHGLERNGATVQNITSYVNLTAKTHGIGMVGGFIGYANHKTLIENCSWYGTFDAGIYRVDSGAGGFIGRIYDSANVTIRNCAAYGTIKTAYKSGTHSNYSTIYIGGFLSYSPSGAQTVMQNNLWAGQIENNTDLTIENAHLSAYGTLNSEVRITNCYADSTLYVTTNNENTNGITTVTAEQLASGEIAYLLQGEQETQVWGQNIDNGEMADAYPVLGGAKVYEYTSDYGDFYSNLENLDMIPNGKCGDKLYWNITDKTLTIFGTGTMWNYDNDSNKAPWIEYSSNLETLVLEEEMTSIGDYAFYECSGFTGELIIPNSVSTIGQSAFFKCSGFTGDLIIPNSVTSIGNFAFMYCSSFTGNLTIGNSVTSIGYSAFNGCSGFTGELMIGNSVTSIDHNAFYECSGFTGDLKIPNSVSTIGQSAFFKCSSFTGDLIIPNSVTSIGNYAFRGCSGFTGDLIIPNSVTSVGKYAFYMCSGFTGNLIIPNSVTSIGDYAFDGCSRFTGDLIIPNNVTSIGDYAFRNCSSFTGNLTIPNSVTFIGDYAFDGCSGFTGPLAIGNSVTSIGDYAFRNYSGFTGELIIPNSVTSIGDGAFYACSELTDVFFYKETSPLFGGDHVFASLNKNAKIYAPVIWESFKIIPPDKLVKMPTWTSQQDWVGLAEGQIEPGENDHVAINAPMELSRQVNILKVKSFGYCGDGTTTNGSITIEEGGQLYCETARGEVTVRKEILGYQQSGSESESKWYTIASPLKEAIDLSNSNTFITSTPFDLYRYDEPTHTWQNAKPGEGSTNFQTIEPGRGYLYANAKYTTLEFKGNINTEDVNYTLTAQSEVLNGFHLVGNPYTHDISFNHLSAEAELANGYYVLKGEGAWGATLGNEGDVIKVGQGALIKTTDADTLTISRDASTTRKNKQDVVDTSKKSTISLIVSNSNYSDKAFVVFDKGVGLDKINHENENIPLLYIPQDGTDYAIAMMDENVSEIPVSFEAMTMGQYTISLQQENCDFEELYLLDKETGEKVNILEEDYTFMATTADNAERFILLKANSQQPTANSSHFAYVSDSDLIISVEGAVQIIDVMGRIIYSNDVTSDNNRIDVSCFDNAAYIVRVVNENGVKVQKIIL